MHTVTLFGMYLIYVGSRAPRCATGQKNRHISLSTFAGTKSHIICSHTNTHTHKTAELCFTDARVSMKTSSQWKVARPQMLGFIVFIWLENYESNPPKKVISLNISQLMNWKIRYITVFFFNIRLPPAWTHNAIKQKPVKPSASCLTNPNFTPGCQ